MPLYINYLLRNIKYLNYPISKCYTMNNFNQLISVYKTQAVFFDENIILVIYSFDYSFVNTKYKKIILFILRGLYLFVFDNIKI